MKRFLPRNASSLQSLRLVFLVMLMLGCLTSPLSILSNSSDDAIFRYAILPASAWLAVSHIIVFRRECLGFVQGFLNACAIAFAGLSLAPNTSASLDGITFCCVFLFMLYGTHRQALVWGVMWVIGVGIAYGLAGELLTHFIIIVPGLVLVHFMQRLILGAMLSNQRLVDGAVASAHVNKALLSARSREQIAGVLSNGVSAILGTDRVESVEFLCAASRDYHVRRHTPATTAFDIVGERSVHGRLEITTRTPLNTQETSAMNVLVGQTSMAFERFETSERLTTLFANSADILLVLEEDGIVSSISPAYQAITGRSVDSAVGKHVRTLLHPEDAGSLLLKMANDGDASATLTLRWRCVDDAWKLTESKLASLAPSGRSGRWTLNARDTSDRAALEVELRHAQKLESVGRLASGVAHEINTPIQFAGNNLHFLKSAFADYQQLLSAYREAVGPETSAELRALEDDLDVSFLEEQIPMAVAQGLEGTERVARIVKAMKTFGHPDGAEQTAVDINELISSTLTVARNEWKYVSKIETNFAELPPVLCFAGDINQVLLNLVVNAAHVIGDKGGNESKLGTITLKTWLDGDNVAISVTDTGTGIPNHVKARIYDPFFTTKEVGRGTGQGLALAKTLIVDRHNGTLDVDTEVNAGTTFTIRIPLAGTRSGAPASAAISAS